jgi:TonB family protein
MLVLSAGLHRGVVNLPVSFTAAHDTFQQEPLSVFLALTVPPEPEAVTPVINGQLPVEDIATSETFPEETPVEVAEQPVSVTSPGHLEEVRSTYWSDVCRRIARHLHYPLVAQRRGMGGLVHLRLTIGPDGSLFAVEADDETCGRLFVDAAIKAVRAGAPYPPPPAELTSPISATLPVRFAVE